MSYSRGGKKGNLPQWGEKNSFPAPKRSVRCAGTVPQSTCGQQGGKGRIAETRRAFGGKKVGKVGKGRSAERTSSHPPRLLVVKKLKGAVRGRYRALRREKTRYKTT